MNRAMHPDAQVGPRIVHYPNFVKISVGIMVKGVVISAGFLIGLLVLALIVIVLLERGMDMYSTYPTIKEAEVDGAMKRRWIPDWLPSNAVEIHEHHNASSNAQAISFGIASPNTFEFSEWCVPTDSASKPSMKTKLMPRSIHKMPDVMMCYGHHVVIDKNGIVHAWKNYH